MIIRADSRTYFVFDLDDTLYFEIDFLKSAFKYIAKTISTNSYMILYEEMLQEYKAGGNAFELILRKYPENNFTIEALLSLYRNHLPEISLDPKVLEILLKIKSRNSKIGIITNGRSITQRNKIKALGLDTIIDEIVISEEFGYEKPNEANYKHFIKTDSNLKFYYFGDNLKNDFITPKKLGWCCIGVMNENLIHKYNISDFSIDYIPDVFVKQITEIEII